MSPKAAARKKRRGPSPQKLAADRRRRRALADVVLERLGDRYDHPTWDGPRVDTVSELILTILTQNTADVNAEVAFERLRKVARSRGRKVHDLAKEVVASAHDPSVPLPPELAGRR